MSNVVSVESKSNISNASTDVLCKVFWEILDTTDKEDHSKLLKQVLRLSAVCKRWYEILHRGLIQKLYKLRFFTELNWGYELTITSLLLGATDPGREGWFINAMWHEDTALTKSEHAKKLDNVVTDRKSGDDHQLLLRQYATTEEFIAAEKINIDARDNAILPGGKDLSQRLAEYLDASATIVCPQTVSPRKVNIFQLPKEKWDELRDEYNKKYRQEEDPLAKNKYVHII